jgi:hypothetical protein
MIVWLAEGALLSANKIVRRTKLCMSASSFAMASFPSPIA